MTIIIRFILAWISAVLLTLLLLKFLLRLGAQWGWPGFRILNRWMGKVHSYLGFVLVASGLAHGLLAPLPLLPPHPGSILWFLAFLMAAAYLLRGGIPFLTRHWMVIHRIMAAAMLCVLVYHVWSVGGIKIIFIVSTYFRRYGIGI